MGFVKLAFEFTTSIGQVPTILVSQAVFKSRRWSLNATFPGEIGSKSLGGMFEPEDQRQVGGSSKALIDAAPKTKGRTWSTRTTLR